MEGLDPDRMPQFIRRARQARGFPLVEGALPRELLTHLNLLDKDAITHAAVLLFPDKPKSSKQGYRLTKKGRALQAKLNSQDQGE